MSALTRLVLGALALLLVGSLAAAIFWPNTSAPSAEAVRRVEAAGAPASDVDPVPASRAIFPKVLHR